MTSHKGMSAPEQVPVTSLHVKCSIRLRSFGQPGIAASDCCGVGASSTVQMPDGARMYRCRDHEGLRWVREDPARGGEAMIGVISYTAIKV